MCKDTFFEERERDAQLHLAPELLFPRVNSQSSPFFILKLCEQQTRSQTTAAAAAFLSCPFMSLEEEARKIERAR